MKCGEKLKQASAIDKKLLFKVPLKYMPDLKVAIRGPAIKCDKCGGEQIKADERISNHISEAIVDAFNKVNLSH